MDRAGTCHRKQRKQQTVPGCCSCCAPISSSVSCSGGSDSGGNGGNGNDGAVKVTVYLTKEGGGSHDCGCGLGRILGIRDVLLGL